MSHNTENQKCCDTCKHYEWNCACDARECHSCFEKREEIMNKEHMLWIGPSYDTKLTFNLKCPKCGAIVNNYMKYCYECGEKIMIEVNTQDAQNEVEE